MQQNQRLARVLDATLPHLGFSTRQSAVNLTTTTTQPIKDHIYLNFLTEG